ncbi:PREDICTED: uncharacterized protein LOC106628039 [Pseudopodoces humilis]|uniref:uncharacterized protein LOC106628039 n=1 Tax=Pseudopodoces humilis TaxID=181119 RepID=UPI0006B7EF7B|nr:PREDICTED: uncharacterized protein LOC106628039 [Pseudopodoces humilis]
MSVSCCTLSLMGSFICKGLELISIIPSLIQLSLQIKRLPGCSLCAEDAAPGGERQHPLPLCSHQPAVPLAQAFCLPPAARRPSQPETSAFKEGLAEVKGVGFLSHRIKAKPPSLASTQVSSLSQRWGPTQTLGSKPKIQVQI